MDGPESNNQRSNPLLVSPAPSSTNDAEAAAAPAYSRSASRELGYLAVAVGLGNGLLLVLFLMSLAGSLMAGVSTNAAPPALELPNYTPASTTDQNVVPDGFRAVCFRSDDPTGMIRVGPSKLTAVVAAVPKGELVHLAGPRPPITAGMGWVKVEWSGGAKPVTGWMHNDILSQIPCR